MALLGKRGRNMILVMNIYSLFIVCALAR